MIRLLKMFGANASRLVICTGIGLGFAPLAANATLGGDSASVVADQLALGATLKVTTMPGYRDYALTLPSGGTVHEFVSLSNRVFEITWSQFGSRPNMAQLLGNYVTRFSGTSNGGYPTSRHADRVEPDFELHSMVVNRVFTGVVHLPQSLPNSLTGPVHLPTEGAR